MVNRTLMLFEAQNIVNWFEEFKEKKIKELPIKTQWYILYGIKELQPNVQKFQEFRDSLVRNLQNEYFASDEKSENIKKEKINDDGAIVFDDNGEPVMESLRKIKDEYIDEYQKKINDMNDEIGKLLVEKTTYSFKEIDVDELVDNLSDGSSINLEDINMISFIDLEKH